MTVVPNELADYILDFLHDDRKALKACSLTCRIWYPTARYHLYRQVHLTSPAACETFYQLLQCEDTRHLGQFTRYLHVSKAIAHTTGDKPQDVIHHQRWSSIFSAVPNVETFHMSFLEMDNTFYSHIIPNFARTTDLTLQYCRFSSFGDFASVLLAFPSLERCTLRGISWENGQLAFTHTAGEQRETQIRIKGLTLGRDIDLQLLVEWLLQEHLCDELESITACCAFESDAAVMGELLRAAAPNLKQVDLDWYCSSYRDVRLPFDFTLASCSSLRTLALRCPIALHSQVPWVNSLVSDVDATQLETITLEIRLLGSLTALDWQRLEQIVTQDTFKSLKTVELKIAVWHTASQHRHHAEAFVRAQLPRLHSKGMLHFVD